MKPKRFLECLLPVTVCNLRCPYCYIIQENRRANKIPPLKYSPEHIAKALRPERLGGICYISICGAGETLVQPECIDIVKLLLEEGHFVNITTNGTQTKKFDTLIEKCGNNINHLHVAFSLHYTELKRLNLIDTYFSNVKKMKIAGASVLVQFNLCDEYLPYLEEIKELSLKNVGALPQVALTRDELSGKMKIYTNHSDEEYYECGKQFNSPLFETTFKNFNVKRKEFCYAGDWSSTLDLQTGRLVKCYQNADNPQYIFDDINKPIDFEAVGRNCKNCYCINSSHFMSLGVIPNSDTPSYAKLRNRKEASWYTPEMEKFLDSKLCESNKKYNVFQKIKAGWHQGCTLKNKIKLAVMFILPQKLSEKLSNII